MIFQEVTPAKQMALRGWSCKTPAQVITIPTPKAVIEFCTCNFFCSYVEKVFADPTDESNKYKNDYKSFLLNLKDPTSTFEIILTTPQGEEIILNDNTFGVFYDKGFNSSQPLQAGFKLEWVKVLFTKGEGDYKIKVTQTDFNNTIEVESHVFKLQKWNEIKADLTVKLEWNQKGKILNGQDYTGLLWSNMLRIEGKFGNHKPQYEINRLQDSNYQDLDIQTSKYNNYQLKTDLLPSEVGNVLTDNLVLTDEIFISVNDVFSYEQYRRLEVSFEGTVDNTDDYARNNMKFFTITFKDRNVKLKRNFN